MKRPPTTPKIWLKKLKLLFVKAIIMIGICNLPLRRLSLWGRGGNPPVFSSPNVKLFFFHHLVFAGLYKALEHLLPQFGVTALEGWLLAWVMNFWQTS